MSSNVYLFYFVAALLCITMIFVVHRNGVIRIGVKNQDRNETGAIVPNPVENSLRMPGEEIYLKMKSEEAPMVVLGILRKDLNYFHSHFFQFYHM